MPDTQLRTTIQTNIVNVLTAVTGVKNVFPDSLGSVRALTPEDVSDRYVDEESSKIHAWFVGRISTASDTAETKYGRVPIRFGIDRTHVFEIEGFYGYESGVSEPVWQNLLDDVITAFNLTRSLGAFQGTPPQLTRVDFMPLTSHLCHHAVLQIAVVEKILGMEPS